jgi:predicted phage terminase large subunit-like protein
MLKPPSLQQIQAEIRRRSLSRFLPYAMPNMRWDWPHTKLIIDHLQALADGEIENLMISCPPQHGKTQVASIGFGAFLLNQRKETRVGIASYSETPSLRISRSIRRIMEGVGAEFTGDLKSVQEWELDDGSKVRATGVGGAFTSFPVDIGILDDPIKDRDQAESLNARDSLWEWFTDVWIARNMKHQVLIGTEWHQDGLHGRIRNAPGSHRWTLLNLPAIALEDDILGRAPGEALCPDRVTLEQLEERKLQNPYSFEAMYQGNPSPREGTLFKVGSLVYCNHDEVPINLPKVRRWDLASSPEGDYTVGLLIEGPCRDGRFYVTDVVRGRWNVFERDQVILQTVSRDGRVVRQVFPNDPGSAGDAQISAMKRMLAGFPVYDERETGSKEVRAEPVASQIAGENIVIARAHWNTEFVEELRTFPRGRHDDQVDTLAGGFNYLVAKRRVSIAV